MHEMRLEKVRVREGWNIRENADRDIGTLAESMEKMGQLHPIVINDKNEIVAGHRRFLAAQRLGWDKIGVIGLQDEDERLVHLDENLERTGLTQPEKEKALAEKYALYKGLVETGQKQAGDFIKETMDQTGMSNTSIYRGIKRHENASDEVWQAYCDEVIGSIQLDELIKLPKKVQDKVLARVSRSSATDTKALVQDELAKLTIPEDFAVKHPTFGTIHCDRFVRLFLVCSEKMVDLLDCFDLVDIENMCEPGQWDKIQAQLNDLRTSLKSISAS